MLILYQLYSHDRYLLNADDASPCEYKKHGTNSWMYQLAISSSSFQITPWYGWLVANRDSLTNSLGLTNQQQQESFVMPAGWLVFHGETHAGDEWHGATRSVKPWNLPPQFSTLREEDGLWVSVSDRSMVCCLLKLICLNLTFLRSSLSVLNFKHVRKRVCTWTTCVVTCAEPVAHHCYRRLKPETIKRFSCRVFQSETHFLGWKWPSSLLH